MLAVTQNHITASAQPPSRAGSDELNLIDFPISLLQHQQPTDANGKRPDELVCTIESYDPDLDRVVPRRLTRRTASKYGFPTPLDEEVLIALLTLTRHKNNFTSARVHFRHNELYELMGWENNGESNKRLSIAIDRLKGLTLKYENAWTGGDDRFEKEFTTGLLDSANLVVQTRGNPGAGKIQSWVQWASEVFADIRRGNVKDLDTDRYFSLDLPLAQRLYRFLDRYLSVSPMFEMDLITFAARMGVSTNGHIGKIKERLAPSIKSLESFGDFIAPASRDERYTKQGPGQWLIRFQKPSSATTPPPKPKTSTKNSRQPNHLAAKKLVTDFYVAWSGDSLHSVTKHEAFQASEVIRKYGAEKAQELMPLMIRQLKKSWPQAKTFGATMNYWHEADKTRKRQEKHKTASSFLPADDKSKKSAEQARIERLREQWSKLTESQRQLIRHRVSQASGPTIRRFLSEEKYNDPLVELACLDELERNPLSD